VIASTDRQDGDQLRRRSGEEVDQTENVIISERSEGIPRPSIQDLQRLSHEDGLPIDVPPILQDETIETTEAMGRM
jgi:hypothetical protein